MMLRISTILRCQVGRELKAFQIIIEADEVEQKRRSDFTAFPIGPPFQ
jgi:hypothetical protein